MLRSDLCDYSDAYIVVKGNITLHHLIKIKTMHHLSTAFQKSMVYKLTLLKI